MQTPQQILLRLISRGHAIVAEIRRLSEFVPEPFLMRHNHDKRLYDNVIVDFVYFSTPEPFDQRREQDAVFTRLISGFK